MKRFFIGYIAGLITCGIVGVSAANYLYHAEEVSFSSNEPKWNVDNVDDALKDLYKKTSTLMEPPTESLDIKTEGTYDVTHFKYVVVGKDAVNSAISITKTVNVSCPEMTNVGFTVDFSDVLSEIKSVTSATVTYSSGGSNYIPHQHLSSISINGTKVTGIINNGTSGVFSNGVYHAGPAVTDTIRIDVVGYVKK